MKTSEEFNRGYSSATKEILNGEDAEKLLNQSRSSLTRDDFDKGWMQACKENL